MQKRLQTRLAHPFAPDANVFMHDTPSALACCIVKSVCRGIAYDKTGGGSSFLPQTPVPFGLL